MAVSPLGMRDARESKVTERTRLTVTLSGSFTAEHLALLEGIAAERKWDVNHGQAHRTVEERILEVLRARQGAKLRAADIVKAIPDVNRNSLRVFLSRLVRRGVVRVEYEPVDRTHIAWYWLPEA